jgi:hypothetical protein
MAKVVVNVSVAARKLEVPWLEAGHYIVNELWLVGVLIFEVAQPLTELS